MPEPFPESILTKAIGPIGTALGTLIGYTAGSTGVLGSALGTLFSVVGGICGLAFSLICRRYISVLGTGAKPKGSLERQAYDKLRESLAEGGSAARLYAQRLTGFLDAVDRFFGDAGMADRTLFLRAFGLKTPASLWTAPAFDRCLFLALVYPIATIFVIWAISGHVGPAEAALHLKPDFTGWQRGLSVALVGIEIFAFWRWRSRTQGWNAWAAWAAVVVASIVVVAFAVAPALAGAVVFVGAGAVAFVGAGAGAVVVAFIVVGAFAFAVAVAFAGAGAVAGAAGGVAFLGAGAVAGAVGVVNDIAIQHRRHGVFLALFLLALILVCLVGANLLAPLKPWEAITGPLLLFLGLLTLLNAPFDWASGPPKTHLEPLRRDHSIDIWDDRRISGMNCRRCCMQPRAKAS